MTDSLFDHGMTLQRGWEVTDSLFDYRIARQRGWEVANSLFDCKMAGQRGWIAGPLTDHGMAFQEGWVNSWTESVIYRSTDFLTTKWLGRGGG